MRSTTVFRAFTEQLKCGIEKIECLQRTCASSCDDCPKPLVSDYVGTVKGRTAIRVLNIQNLFKLKLRDREIAAVCHTSRLVKPFRRTIHGCDHQTLFSIGCCLRYFFGWSWEKVVHPEAYGQFYSPREVAGKLMKNARKRGFHQIRISGNKPTIVRAHPLKILVTV